MNDHCSFTPILFQSLPFTFCYVNEPTPETTPLSRPLLLDFVVPLFSHVRIMEEVWFPGSTFYYFVKVVISLVTLVALFQAKVQFTVAQWADTSIDEHSLMSCMWACFPDGFPHHAWTAVSPLWLCWVMGICVFSCSLPPALLALQLGSFICYCGNRGGVGNWSQNKESALKVYSGEENSPTISWPGWNPHPSDHKSGAVALGCILSIWDACKWWVLL